MCSVGRAGKNSGKGTLELLLSAGTWGLLLEGQRAGSTEQHYEPGSKGALEEARVSSSTLIIREHIKPLFRLEEKCSFIPHNFVSLSEIHVMKGERKPSACFP